MKRLVQLLVVEGAVGGPLTACDNTWARTNAAAPAPQATIQTATTIEDKTTKEVRGLPVNRIRGRASPAGWRTCPSHRCSGRVPLMPTTKNSPLSQGHLRSPSLREQDCFTATEQPV